MRRINTYSLLPDGRYDFLQNQHLKLLLPMSLKFIYVSELSLVSVYE